MKSRSRWFRETDRKEKREREKGDVDKKWMKITSERRIKRDDERVQKEEKRMMQEEKDVMSVWDKSLPPLRPPSLKPSTLDFNKC